VIGLLLVSTNVSLLTSCKFVLAQLIAPVILVWLVHVAGLTGSVCTHYISEVAHCSVCSVSFLLFIVLISVYLTTAMRCSSVAAAVSLQQCRCSTCIRWASECM